jgi:hypothetical protein
LFSFRTDEINHDGKGKVVEKRVEFVVVVFVEIVKIWEERRSGQVVGIRSIRKECGREAATGEKWTGGRRGGGKREQREKGTDGAESADGCCWKKEKKEKKKKEEEQQQEEK